MLTLLAHVLPHSVEFCHRNHTPRYPHRYLTDSSPPLDLPAARNLAAVGVETGRWFIDAKALAAHKKSRFYKMRVKELKGAAPHSQRDAEMAVGLGIDNGPKLRPKTTMDTD
jgi:hypothetical protein